MPQPFSNSSRPGQPRESGVLDSLRTLAGSVLDLLHIRVELFAVEWQEEQERGKHLLVLAIAGALLLMLGMLVLTVFVIAAFWDTYRLTAIGVVTLLYFGGGFLCLWNVRTRLRNRPSPFAGSLSEFIEDLKQLRSDHEDEGRLPDATATGEQNARDVDSLQESRHE